MYSILPFPSGTMKNTFRGHRLVVLPDYQGLGIGTRLQNFFGEYYLKQGKRLLSRSTHYKLAKSHLKNPCWRETSTSNKPRPLNEIINNPDCYKFAKDTTRVAYSFEYVGKDFSKEHRVIVCFGDCDKFKAKQLLLKRLDSAKYNIIVSGEPSASVVNVWEQCARELGLRQEVLFLKRKGELYLNTRHLNTSFDLITTYEGLLDLKDYKKNIRELEIIS